MRVALLISLFLLVVHSTSLDGAITDEPRDEETITNHHGKEPQEVESTTSTTASPIIEELLQRGKGSAALPLIEEAILRGNSTDAMQLNLGRATLQSGNWELGEEILNSIEAKGPSSSAYIDASLLLGKLSAARNDKANTMKFYQHVLDIDARNVAALAGLGKHMVQPKLTMPFLPARNYHTESIGKAYSVQKNDHATGIAYFEKAVEINDGDATVIFDFAVVLLQANDSERAHFYFERAKTVGAAMNINRKMIADLYLRFNQHTYGVKELESMHENREAITTEHRYILSDYYENVGETSKAESMYREILEENPQDTIANAHLGLLLLGTGLRNSGATSACGLNSLVAVELLTKALMSKTTSASNDGIKSQEAYQKASVALAFCKQEIEELTQWEVDLTSPIEATQIGHPSALAAVKSRIITSVRAAVKSAVRFICYDGLFIKHLPFVGEACSFFQGFISTISARSEAVSSVVSSGRVSTRNKEVMNKKFEMLDHWKTRESSIPALQRRQVETTEALMQLMKANKPAIITNFQKNWAPKESFSDSSLLNKFGESIIRVSLSPTGRFDGPERGSLWGLNDDVEGCLSPIPARFGPLILHSDDISFCHPQSLFALLPLP